jgi:hypothetical protein
LQRRPCYRIGTPPEGTARDENRTGPLGGHRAHGRRRGGADVAGGAPGSGLAGPGEHPACSALAEGIPPALGERPQRRFRGLAGGRLDADLDPVWRHRPVAPRGLPRRRSPAAYLLRRADQRRGRPTGLRRPLPLPARCRRRRVLQCLFRRPDGRPAPDHPGWHAQSGAGLLARRQDRRLGVGEQGRAGLRHRHLAARRARRAQSPSRATERSIPSPFRRTAGRSFSAI